MRAQPSREGHISSSSRPTERIGGPIDRERGVSICSISHALLSAIVVRDPWRFMSSSGSITRDERLKPNTRPVPTQLHRTAAKLLFPQTCQITINFTDRSRIIKFPQP